MSYNSKNVTAVEEIFQCTSTPNLSEGTCQKSLSYNWGSYEQKAITYVKEAFVQLLLKHVALIFWVINLIRDSFKYGWH